MLFFTVRTTMSTYIDTKETCEKRQNIFLIDRDRYAFNHSKKMYLFVFFFNFASEF